MGFTKLVRTARTEDKFVPSTKEDLKRYAKAGKARRTDRAEGRTGSKGARLLMGEKRKLYRDLFCKLETFDVLKDNLLRDFAEACKEVGIKVPRYKEYLKKADADADFLFDVNYAMSRMSWMQLGQMVNHAVGCVVPTHDQIEAYRFAWHAFALAMKVAEKDGTYRLTDLDVLNSWPVATQKRPSKEDTSMSKKEAAAVASGKSKLKARADDEDEEDDDETGVEESEDESEDDEDEADEKPVKKAKKAKYRADEPTEDDDEDEDDEGDEEADEDEEDEEDEKPVKKAKKAPAKKASKDEDEEEEADEDEEDEKPTKRGKSAKETDMKTKETSKGRPEKMKLKGPIPKAKKAEKAEKAEKPAKAEKAAKADKKAPKPEKPAKKPSTLKLTPASVISKVKDRPKTGPKTELLNLISKKGTKLSKLEAEAEESLKMNAKKVAKYLAGLSKYGFIEVA